MASLELFCKLMSKPSRPIKRHSPNLRNRSRMRSSFSEDSRVRAVVSFCQRTAASLCAARSRRAHTSSACDSIPDSATAVASTSSCLVALSSRRRRSFGASDEVDVEAVGWCALSHATGGLVVVSRVSRPIPFPMDGTTSRRGAATPVGGMGPRVAANPSLGLTSVGFSRLSPTETRPSIPQGAGSHPSSPRACPTQ